MERWIGICIVILLSFNTYYLVTLSSEGQSNTSKESNQAVQSSYSENTPLSQSSIGELASVQKTLLHLTHQVRSLEETVKRLKTDSTFLSRNNEMTEKNEYVTESKNRQDGYYTQYDQQGEQSVNTVIASGSLSQMELHSLRETMSKMSAEAHKRELQKLVMAINRGDIELEPGVIF